MDINGYWLSFYWDYYWLLMIILLMAFGSYYIGGY
jgi:hypothetical protein